MQAAAAWMAVKPPGVAHADWCYLQLRKHVCSISEAADDAGLELAARQALQRLLLTALTGNLALAARQGQQVRSCAHITACFFACGLSGLQGGSMLAAAEECRLPLPSCDLPGPARRPCGPT